MLRSLMVLLTVGFVGLVATSLIFSLLVPIVVIALKIAIFCAIGYFILRLVKPGMAENLRKKVRRDES